MSDAEDAKDGVPTPARAGVRLVVPGHRDATPTSPAAPTPTLAADEPSDGELVTRFRGGDRGAFDVLVRRHQRPVYWLARRYVGNDADAKDVAQRALVRAFTQVGSLRDERSFRYWLYKTAVNLALNVVRDRRPSSELDDETAAAPPLRDPVVAGESQRRLRAAVAELPPQQRLVVELRVYEELPFREVAAIADCSEESARVNYHHALKRLRQRMQQDEP